MGLKSSSLNAAIAALQYGHATPFLGRASNISSVLTVVSRTPLPCSHSFLICTSSRCLYGASDASRYLMTHCACSALRCAGQSRMPRPPCPHLMVAASLFIQRLNLVCVPFSSATNSGSLAHMRASMSLCVLVIVDLGMSMLCAQYLNLDQMKSLDRSTLPFWVLVLTDRHSAMRDFIFLYFESQNAVSSMFLPNGTPRHTIVSPSLAHWAFFMIGVSGMSTLFILPSASPSVFLAFANMPVAPL